MGIKTNHGERVYEIPVESRLHAACLFYLNEPGILRGLSAEMCPGQSIPRIWVHCANLKAVPQMHEIAKGIEPDNTGMTVPAAFNAEVFGKMLAKIGHAYAVAKMGVGLEGFEPLLPKAIIGKAPWQHGYLVGGEPCQIVKSKWKIEVKLLKRDVFGGGELGYARIRLFGRLGAPVYLVVFGKRKAEPISGNILLRFIWNLIGWKGWKKLFLK